MVFVGGRVKGSLNEFRSAPAATKQLFVAHRLREALKWVYLLEAARRFIDPLIDFQPQGGGGVGNK